MSKMVRLASVLVALSLSSVVAGCAGEVETASATDAQETTSTYDGVTVVGERAANGNVRSEAKNDRGDALLVLRVEGDRLMVEPHDRTIAAWSGTVPADALATNQLEDWSYLAFAYSQHLSSSSLDAKVGAVRPQMMSAGTDGQMCIAAGSTAMECAYYLYCRKNWCPFW